MAGFNNSIILSDLKPYIDQISYNKINTELVLQGTTVQSGVELLRGIKNGQTVNVATSQLVGQPGNNCGLISPTGSFTIQQTTLQVCPIKFEESICEDQIQLYWMGMSMPVGSYYEGDLTPQAFAEAYVFDKVQKIQDALEFLHWQGSTTGATFGVPPTAPNNYPALAPLCDGFLEVLNAASASVVPYSGTFSGPLTFANALSVVGQLIQDMTEAAQNVVAQQDVIMYMSIVNYRTYVNALALQANGAGNFNYIGVENNQWTIKYLGTNVTIWGVPGLVGSNYIVLTPASNLVIGMDGQDDQDRFDVWYERLYDSHFFRAKMKTGVAVKYAQYVTMYFG